nr:peptide chain release factor 2 [Candidatus Nesciobacter abundans]
MFSKIEKYINLLQDNLKKLDLENKLLELSKEVENPNLWDDKEKAQQILKEHSQTNEMVGSIKHFSEQYINIKEMTQIPEFMEDAAIESNELLEQLKPFYVNLLFSEQVDKLDCFVSLNSGAGGTEAQDWTEMLMRMYLRFFEKNNFKAEILHEQKGEEAGVKSAEIKVSSNENSFPYGWTKGESGVHRLVRISPFDSNSRRHTSFASVWVTPVINQEINIEIEDKDIRIDTYRASGAGGQHVNKTDSAVRITHIESGIVVQCQNDRSQHRNKAEAMQMLKSKLYAHEKEKAEKEASENSAKKKDNSWGSQIRSYVMHPYRMVKDLRTGHESGQVEKIMDGDIKEFLVKYLEKSSKLK